MNETRRELETRRDAFHPIVRVTDNPHIAWAGGAAFACGVRRTYQY